MAMVIRMPGVSADSDEAALVEWSVPVGTQLNAGDPLAVVETEKANVDIAVDDDGILWRTLAEPGDSVAVGNPIAVLLAEGEDDVAGEAMLATVGAASATDERVDSAGVPLAPVANPPSVPGAPTDDPLVSPAAIGDSEGRRAASPLVRRLAREAGIPLDSLHGTGPRGRIVRADLERALAEASPPPESASPASGSPAPEQVRLARHTPALTGAVDESSPTRLRRAIANALVSSKRNAPHFYLTATVSVDALIELRATVNKASNTRLTMNDFIVKAVARAFVEVPEMNVVWDDEILRRFQDVDLAVAIDSPRGLVTPVLRGADRLTVSEISARVRDLAHRAGESRLKQEELTGGVFTISNLGMFGVEEFTAIINPPHVGILAVGAAVKRPVVVDDEIVIARTMTVTASFDHRPIDGALAARWLAAFTAAIEYPLTALI